LRVVFDAEDHLTPVERDARGSYVGCIAGALSKPSISTGWLLPVLLMSPYGSPIKQPKACTAPSSKPASRRSTVRR
jgi:hypothetical protein